MHKVDTRLIALGFFLAAILLRFLPHWPNFTPVAAMALFAGCYLSGHVGFVLAFGAMAISDCVANWLAIPGMHFYDTPTMLTVYLALALTAMVGRGLRGRVNMASVPLASLAGTALFFITTNFACWQSPMMGYPQTLAGLVQCYIAAIPFAVSTLCGDLFYSALLFGGYVWVTADRRTLFPAFADRR